MITFLTLKNNYYLLIPLEKENAKVLPRLHVMVPLYGREATFSRFVHHLALSATSYPGGVHLYVAYYHKQDDANKQPPSISEEVKEVISMLYPIIYSLY